VTVPFRSAIDRRRLVGMTGLGLAGLAGGARLPTAAAQEPVTLSYLTDFAFAQEVCDRFTEAHPDIRIAAELVTFREVFQQNQVRLGAKSDNPDIVAVDAPVVASYGLRGWLLPLDDQFSEEETAAWVPALNDSGRYEGSLLAPPIWNSSQLFFYNLDLLEAAGVTPPGPEERWTWDQVTEAAQAVTTPDIFGFQFEQYNRIYQLQPLPQGLGAPVIGEDGLTVKGIVDSPEWIEAFTWFGRLHNEWKVAPQGANIEVEALFNEQKLAMCVRGPWAIKSFTEADLPFQWRAAPHPYWGGNNPIHVPTDSWHLGVNPNSQHVEETIRFVKWASSVEGGRVWREIHDSWPAQQELLTDIFEDPANTEWPNRAYPIAAAEAEYATPRPLTVGYLEYEEILSDAFEDIRNGSDPAQSLTAAADRIDREMEKYRR
jgi:multiple sugar transport system substrate-binding protein